MKIAQVLGPPLLLTGTGQARVIPISKELVRNGHAVAIFAPTMAFKGIERTEHEGLPVIKTGQYFVYSGDDRGFGGDYRRESRVPELLSLIFAWALSTIRELKAFRPDVVQVYTTQPNAILFVLLARVLMPFTRICVDYDDLYGGEGGSYDYEGNPRAAVLLLGLAERLVRRFAHKASACSHFFRLHYGIDTIIPNSVDTDLLARGPGAVDQNALEAIRVRHGIKPGDKVVIAVSRFKELYDYDLLVKAAGVLRGKFRDFRMIFIGDGEHRNALAALAEKEGLGGNLTFTGWVQDEELLKHYYFISDICVIPMRNRKLHLARCPIKLLDAIAARLCIVAPDIGEPAHILKDGVNALLYRAGDTADIADKLHRLMTDAPLRKKLATGATALIPDYSHKRVARLWEEHLRSAAGRA